MRTQCVSRALIVETNTAVYTQVTMSDVKKSKLAAIMFTDIVGYSSMTRDRRKRSYHLCIPGAPV